MIRFFKMVLFHYRKKAYLTGALSVQSAMLDKQEEISIKLVKSDGSEEIITYKLAN